MHGVGIDQPEEPRVWTPMPSSVEVFPEVAFEVNNLEALWLVGDLYVLRQHSVERIN